MCEGLILEQDIYILKNLPMQDGDFNPSAHNPIIQGWLAFDTALRNELVKIRAQHKHIDPQKYLRPVSPRADFSLGHLALAAHRNPSLIEGERSLDEARWEALEELERGHYFDTAFLLVYAYKLKLLERWDRINSADKTDLLEKLLEEKS